MRIYHRDEFLTLTEAAKLLPGPPSESTLRRWSDNGTYGVRLTTYTADGQRVTTVEDILQFIAKQSGMKRLTDEIEEHYRRCEAELRAMKVRQEQASAMSESEDDQNEHGLKSNAEDEYQEEPKVWGIAGSGRNYGTIFWLRGSHPPHIDSLC